MSETFVTPPAAGAVNAAPKPPSAEELKLAEASKIEEKKKALRAELAKLEASDSEKPKTLEERVFVLESTVASLAGHSQPVPATKQ